MLSIAVLLESGLVGEIEIHGDVTKALSRLPDRPDDYFEWTPNSQLIPVNQLIASHIRNDGVVNANKLLKSSAQNAGTKRQPITIRRFGDRYLVLDGNSTLINAKFSDWAQVPCEIE
jgi:hypothetical protein